MVTPEVAAFADALSRLGHPTGARLAVAVSGGSDSFAALWLAVGALGPAAVLALTVDHGLRAGSADEAAEVARWCARRGVAHATLAWEGAKPTGDVQAAARAARYRLLTTACVTGGAAWLVTAHHADDQAETILMRLARGAGPAGLAAVRARRLLPGGVTLVRPLLAWPRARLRALAVAARLPVVDDPANADPRFDRTAARAVLAGVAWLRPERLAAAAERLAEGEAALAWVAARAWEGRVAFDADGLVLDAAGLPAALIHRLVARAVGAIDPAARPRGAEVARAVARLAAGRAATLGEVLARPGATWRFVVAPARAGAVPQDCQSTAFVPHCGFE